MRPLAQLIAALLAAVCVLQAVPAVGQGAGGAEEHVAWTVAAQPEAVRPGGTARITLRVAIDDGWKMYAPDSPPPTRGVTVRLDSLPPALAAGALRHTEPAQGYDPNFDLTVRTFEGEAALHVPLAVEATAEPGRRDIRGEVEYMLCTDALCLPPARKAFAAAVNVQLDGDAAAVAEDAASP